jgi:hypothetical protein
MQKHLHSIHIHLSKIYWACLGICIVFVVFFSYTQFQNLGFSSISMGNYILIATTCSIVIVGYLLFRLKTGLQLLKLAEAKTILSEEKYRNIIENVASELYTTDHKAI